MQRVFYIKIRNSAQLSMAYPNDACFDIAASLTNGDITIKPGERTAIGTGIILIPEQGIFTEFRSKSGLALKHGVTILNSPATIDNGYRGEVKVILINLGTADFIVHDGDKIAQIRPVIQYGFHPLLISFSLSILL